MGDSYPMNLGVRIGIIVNPKHARTNRAYSTLTAVLKSRHIRYRSIATTAIRDGAWQAEALRDWGADLVIILGGDGTIRTSSSVLARAEIPVLLVPTGTANVLSRHVGIRSQRDAVDFCLRVVTEPADGRESRTSADDLLGAPRTVPFRREVLVPVNTAEYLSVDGHWHADPFISLAGIGGDARAVAGHARAPGLLGYTIGAGTALSAPNIIAAINTSDTTFKPAWSIMAAKATRPAGPIPVFPHARIDGEEFEFLTVGPLSENVEDRVREWARIAWDCLCGRPEANRCMGYGTGTTMTIRCAKPAPAQLDGDLIGDCHELRLSAGRIRLRVLAPAT